MTTSNCLALLAILSVGLSCGDDDEPSTDGDADTDTDSDTDGDTDGDTDVDTDADTDTGNGECVPVECGGPFVWQCANCDDDDDDGLVDSRDPDCLGPCDDTEVGYDLGIAGGGEAPCQLDCYYDHDTGTGNDTCVWNHFCDPLYSGDPPYPEESCPPVPDGLRAQECPDTQADDCHTLCGPLTPNGCDCFGCCEIEPDSGEFVWLGSKDYETGQTVCTPEVLDDPAMCHPCTPVADCFNDCGKCELCFGEDELPPGCDPEEGGARCPGGEQPCGLDGDEACPVDFFCVTGCCQPILL